MAKVATSPKPAGEQEGTLVRIWRYLQEVGVELRKTTWPSKSELARSTMVVIAAVAIVAAWIYICEFVMVQITRKVLHFY
jgi:preprotein translocase SecE subunit